MLMMLGAVGLTRPVLAATPDFTISTNPSRVTIPLGYWAETMLTLTSLNGFEGTIQLDAPVGSSTGLAGAGFSTGMTLGPNGSVSTDLELTPGEIPGNYSLNVTATIGSVSHYLMIPITVSPVSGPDFTTRLWGPYAPFQGWNIMKREKKQFVSPGGFKGQVGIPPTATPNVPNALTSLFQPSTAD